MNICIVALNDFFDTYGGTEVYVRNLIDELIKRDDINPFIISRDGKNGTSFYHGITLYHIANKDDIKQILSQTRPDIVHTHGMFDWVVPICNELGIKCIITMHIAIQICPLYSLLDYKGRICTKEMSIRNCLRCKLSGFKGGALAYPFVKHIPAEKYILLGRNSDKRPFRYYITPVLRAALGIHESMEFWRKYICQADKVIQLNPRMVDLAKRNGLPEEKIVLLPNGIPAVQQAPPFPPIENGIKFFYTGRLVYTKGIHILLAAFHKIKNKNAELHIIGDDKYPYAQNLKKKYSKDSRIIWHGFVSNENINDTIRPYHVCVLPSIANETSSLSILEALAMGKYAIATRCGGPEPMIIEGVNGVLVNSNDTKDFYTKLKQYIESPLAPSQIVYSTMDENANKLYNIYSKI